MKLNSILFLSSLRLPLPTIWETSILLLLNFCFLHITHAQDPSLVVHYALNDGDGFSALNSADQSGESMAVIQGGFSWIPAGPVNGALSLDGQSGQVLETSPASALNFGTGDFTIAFWVKKLESSVGNSWDNIFGINQWNTAAQPGSNRMECQSWRTE